MISVNNVSLWFGSRQIFNKISFKISPDDKIGLTGKNGQGKSTLLKLLTKELSPDEGNLFFTKDIKIGYLPQHLTVSDTTHVLAEALKAFDEVKRLEAEYEQLNRLLEQTTNYQSKEYEKTVLRLAEISERLHILEANKTEQYTIKTLLGLGFEEKDLKRPTSEFSGGWRMRIEIAKLLLAHPDLLLLDEPTNHLDIESIIWLENFLKNYSGAVVLISHDTRFLDAVTQRTMEISNGKIYDYPVTYTEYKKLRKQRIEYERMKYENELKKIKQTERFIERFRYKATKASQVQSRIKQLEKTELPEMEEEDHSTIHFSFPEAPRSGDIVVELTGITKKYGALTVLKEVDFLLERREKVAFVGKNGEGKTTLAKIIVGELDFEGNRKIGYNVATGYFAQNQETRLEASKTVLQTVIDAAPPDMTEAQLRTILGNFLFSDDDITKKVSVLSGGEKARLALACMVLKRHNLLVLDEPTNHLDIYAKDRLKKALQQFNGSLIIVSHDRDFLKGLVHTVYEFRHKGIKQYKGDIDFFLTQKKAADFYEFEKDNISGKSSRQKPKETKEGKQLYMERKQWQKQLNKLQKQIQNTETEIEKTENALNELESKFNHPEQLKEADFQAYNEKKQALEDLMEQWETLNSEYEALSKKFESKFDS